MPYTLLKKLVGWSILLLVLVLIIDRFVMPVYVRLGSSTELPDITGKEFSEAKRILESSGFHIVRGEEMVYPQYKPGTVIRQSPEPHSMVKAGRRIYVTLSTAEKPVTVPNVIGQSERDAQIVLSAAGLTVDSTVAWEYSPTYPEGVVCDQSIYEGTRTARGTTVRLTMSLGQVPREVEVPNFLLKNFAVVEREISKTGLVLGKVRFIQNNEYLPNTVLRQVPEPGVKVLPGDSVHVIISVLEASSADSTR